MVPDDGGGWLIDVWRAVCRCSPRFWSKTVSWDLFSAAAESLVETISKTTTKYENYNW